MFKRILIANRGEIARRIIGLGVLQPYLEIDGIEEIIVRASGGANGFTSISRTRSSSVRFC